MEVLNVLINLLNIVVITAFCYSTLKRRTDSSLFWLLLCLLYFTNIPLLFDSLAFFWIGADGYTQILKASNDYWEAGNYELMPKVSAYSFIFNLTLMASYLITTHRKLSSFSFPKIQDAGHSAPVTQSAFFPFGFYLAAGLAGLLLFMWLFGLTAITKLGTGNYTPVFENRYVNFFQGFFLSIASIGVIKGMFERKYFMTLLISLPIVLVGYITEARAKIIALAFCFLYYFIWANSFRKISWRKIVLFGGGCLLLVYILTSYRGGMGMYPITKDWSYADLFYSFKNQAVLTTHGEDMKRLVLTGFYPYEAQDITFKLADYKFFKGWGSLHPTLLAWAYIDLGSFYWIVAFYIGFFLGLCDLLRHRLSTRYGLLFLPFVFTFVSTAARGSVQFAYAAIIYPFILMCLYLIYRSFKKRSERYEVN